MNGSTAKGGAQPPSVSLQGDSQSANTTPQQNVTTRHNCSGVTQITSLLETMYIDSDDEERQQSGDEADNATEQLQELYLRAESLYDHLREAVDSTPIRENGLRPAVEAAATGANEYTDEGLHRFDQAI